MTDGTTRRTEQEARAKKKRREELLIPEIGGGIGDLCQGAVNKYAPRLAWSEPERAERVAEHRRVAHEFLPFYQLAAEPSTECLDALAVWHPLPLRHLLSLDPQPQLRLVDARLAVDSAKQQHDFLDAILQAIARTDAAIELLATDESVESLSSTHAAIGDIAQFRTTGIWAPQNSLTREDVVSDKLRTLEHVEHILRYLKSDVRSQRNRAASQLKRTRTELNSVTGAKEWSAAQSLRVSRRLVTLVDALRGAYPDGRWTWRRIGRLIRESSTDWTTPPCPELSQKSLANMMPLLKMRDRRERARRTKLKLTTSNLYPWLSAGNRLDRRP